MNPGRPSPAADPWAPYVRLAVVALIRRDGGTEGPPSHGDIGGERPHGERPHTGPTRASATWLLLHRKEPLDAWDPPGGRMEEGEDLASAVLREVSEETGLSVQVAGPCYALLTVYKGERLLVVSIACRPTDDADQVSLEPGGAVEWGWFTADEWEELAASGRSSWDARDVRRATRMATVLWEMEDD